ncbi:OmpA family protein [Pseudoalteromonas ulvae]|uniref:OmpA-like domain-containing protein n=1 Tax=Pseudoalteromonas ulvae TaxID=107327 RepID=A0A244CSD2_PSEDV|nr:OmpA family protein [Pseudoalteromonas ulvae]OUL58488.1 hypothetical protein B1199_09175 [Pseudoalteromonas ulvae]
MKHFIAVSLISLVAAGCTSWPDEGQGGWAEHYTPQGVTVDEAWHYQTLHQVENEFEHLSLKLEMLITQGLGDCMPAQLYQANLMRNRIKRELTANMVIDAQADLSVWYHQLNQLDRHFKYIVAQTQCASTKQASEQSSLFTRIEQLLNSDNQFAFNNFQVTPKYMTGLAQAAELIKMAPELNILLVGHADARGQLVVNYELAFKRAEQVKYWLMMYGVQEAQLTTLTQGALSPYQQIEQTAASQHSDRRVNAYLLTDGKKFVNQQGLTDEKKVSLSQWTDHLQLDKE